MSTESSFGDQVPEEVQAFVAGLPSAAGAKVERDATGWRIRLSPTKQPINLGEIDKGHVAIDVNLGQPGTDRARSLTIRDVRTNVELSVRITKTSNEGALHIRDLDGRANLQNETTDKVSVKLTGSQETVEFGPGFFDVDVTESADAVALIADTDTRLKINGRVGKLYLSERCEIEPGNQRIGRVVVSEEATSIGIVGNKLMADSIVAEDMRFRAERYVAKLTVAQVPTSSRNLPKETVVDVERIVNITLQTEKNPLSLVVKKYADHLVVGNDVSVSLKSGSADVLGSLGSSKLTIGKSVVATNVTGKWTLGTVAEAHIRGAEQGFEIEAIVPASPQGKSNLQALVQGAVFTNFRLPNQRKRRQLLAVLDAAYHLDPDVRDLPGTGPAYNERRPLRWRLSADYKNNLPTDTEFV